MWHGPCKGDRGAKRGVIEEPREVGSQLAEFKRGSQPFESPTGPGHGGGQLTAM